MYSPCIVYHDLRDHYCNVDVDRKHDSSSIIFYIRIMIGRALRA